MNRPERTLALLLRIIGLAAFSAIVPAFMPFAWMEAIHGWLGLGELPGATIVHYLTRSTSLLYAGHGAVLIFISFNVPRYLPVLQFIAVVAGAFGFGMLAVDMSAGMPWFWTISEGPFLIIAGIVLWWLTMQIQRELAQEGEQP
jgi:hypothetical protein